MGFEQRLSDIVHELADADPPADLVARTVARLPERRHRRALFVPSPLALAAGVAALAFVVLVVVAVWRPGPLPPAQVPSPSPTYDGRGPCPDAYIEGVLVPLDDGSLGIRTTQETLPVRWDSRQFSIDATGGNLVVLSPGGRYLAFDGDRVRLAGGMDGTGWHACGEVQLTMSAFIRTGDDGLRTFRWDTRAECPAFGVANPVVGTLEGDLADDLEPVWLRSPEGNRLSVVWPRGYTVAAEPQIALRNEIGDIVASAGSRVELQVDVTDARGTYEDPFVAAGILFGRCYPAVDAFQASNSPPATPPTTPTRTPRECPAALIEGTLVEVAPGELGLQFGLLEPVSPTPIVTRVTWEPAFFTIVEDQAGRPAVQHDSGIVAFIGDYVSVGGGQGSAGWYACGSLEIISSPLPSPSPVVETDDAQAWDVLVALENELGRIGRIRRLERSSAGALMLEFSLLESDRARSEVVNQALSRLGLTGDAAVDQTRDGRFVTIRLQPGAPVLLPTPTLGCGERLEMYYRIEVPSGARLAEAQTAAALALEQRVVGTLADRFEVHAIPHLDGQVLVVLTGNYGPVDEEQLHEAIAGPLRLEFGLAPPDSDPYTEPAGSQPLFGGAGVALAGPAVDFSGRPAVQLSLTAEAAAALDAAAADHQGSYLVIKLDDLVQSAPTINARSFGGELLLSGDFTVGRTVRLARALAAGADQIEVMPDEWRTTRVEC